MMKIFHHYHYHHQCLISTTLGKLHRPNPQDGKFIANLLLQPGATALSLKGGKCPSMIT